MWLARGMSRGSQWHHATYTIVGLCACSLRPNGSFAATFQLPIGCPLQMTDNITSKAQSLLSQADIGRTLCQSCRCKSFQSSFGGPTKSTNERNAPSCFLMIFLSRSLLRKCSRLLALSIAARIHRTRHSVTDLRHNTNSKSSCLAESIIRSPNSKVNLTTRCVSD